MSAKLDEHFSDPMLSVEKMESFKGPDVVKRLTKWLWASRSYAKGATELRPKLQRISSLHAELHALEREQALIS